MKMEDQTVTLTRPVFTHRAWQECVWNLRSADTGYFKISVKALLNSHNYIKIGQGSEVDTVDHLFVLRQQHSNNIIDAMYLDDPMTRLFYIGDYINPSRINIPIFHSYVYQSSMIILFQWRYWYRYAPYFKTPDKFLIHVTQTNG